MKRSILPAAYGILQEMLHRTGVITRVLLVAALLVVSAGYTFAQFGRGGFFNSPVRLAPSAFPDRNFVVCRLMYTSVRREPSGGGWRTDYPYGEINLTIRFSELTRTPVSQSGGREPNHYVVRLTDDELFQCPFTMASDVGTIGLTDEEAERLRLYLLKGGFLWVDDFWGTPAWDQWTDQIMRVLPEFPIVDVAPGDPIRHALFNITEVKQVPSIFSWGGPGSDPRERGSDSPHANFRAIADGHGRIMVAMTHNTDIGDSMEREGDDPAYFAAFSPDGYALATNIVLYSLTH